jgi:FkbM family methyltransferase
MKWARALLKSLLSLLVVSRGGLDRLDIEEFAYRSKRSLEALCRARAQPVYLGENEGLCRILGRYKLYVDTRDQGFCANLLLDGFWEMGLTMYMARAVRPGMVAIDIGANFGYYTILLGALVGERGHVYAIEPAPLTAAMLQRSIKLNGLQDYTTVVEVVAGASDGAQALLYVPHREPKNAAVVASPDAVDQEAGTLYQVSETSIDALVVQRPRVDFIKIDAEGSEDAIVAGMLATLRRDKPLLVLEFNTVRSRDPGALLATLGAIYGRLRYVDLHGRVHTTTAAQLISERVGSDWLLVFGP